MVYFVLVLGLLVLQFVFFSYQVGVQRVKTGTKAPSMDGPESFMRALRVQMNTLEGLVTTIPAMLMLYMLNKPVWAAIGGFIYLIARFWYAAVYNKDPGKRGAPFSVGLLASVGMVLVAMVLAVMRWVMY